MSIDRPPPQPGSYGDTSAAPQLCGHSAAQQLWGHLRSPAAMGTPPQPRSYEDTSACPQLWGHRSPHLWTPPQPAAMRTAPQASSLGISAARSHVDTSTAPHPWGHLPSPAAMRTPPRARASPAAMTTLLTVWAGTIMRFEEARNHPKLLLFKKHQNMMSLRREMTSYKWHLILSEIVYPIATKRMQNFPYFINCKAIRYHLPFQ